METAMPTALETVKDYITDVRVLLQDTIAPFRYDDPSLLTSFNVILMEGRRLRPDLFVYCSETVPSFAAVADTKVNMEQPFRLAFVYGTTAHAIARDQEDVQDARAATFMQAFTDMLLGLRPTAIQGGGTPAGGGKK